MKIFKTDTPVVVAAKKAAMICEYAIHSPLHATFEDGNYHYDPMDWERKWNDKYRAVNGELMYQFTGQFLDEFDALSKEERREAFRLFRKKWDYLGQKWRKKVIENSSVSECGTCCYHHYLAEDGHIYVRTNKDVVLLQF